MHPRTRGSVIVIGAHRSGTTMMAGLLRRMGVHMGADCDVQEESDFFRKLNILTLNAAGASWYQPGPMKQALGNQTQCKVLVEKLRRAVRSPAMARYLGGDAVPAGADVEVPGSPWGWKDPRTTVTLPLWRQVCGDVRVIHIIRNGVDVAHSLIERERSTSKRPFLTLQYLVHLARPWRASEVKWVHFRDLGEAFALWSEYVQFGLDATALMNPAELFVTRYEDVLADPSRAVTRIAAFLGISIDTTLIEDLVSEVAIDRRFGFAAHPHLRRFYDRCSDHPLMAHFGYDRLHD